MNGDSFDCIKAAAREAARAAYAPYSKFHVGAGLETEDGSIFKGCNVENASYGLTICAERSAVFQAVAEGHRKFSKICIYTPAGELPFPCGACRQVLSEFAPKIPIMVFNETNESLYDLEQLLPFQFELKRD